jgi:hypothetical protein
MGLSIGRFSLSGAIFDHITFLENDYDAASLIAIGRATWSIHTSQDTVDNLNLRGFNQAGRIAVRVIEKLSGAAFNSTQVNQLGKQPARKRL